MTLQKHYNHYRDRDNDLDLDLDWGIVIYNQIVTWTAFAILDVFKWKGNFTQLHMKYGSPGPAHSSESPFSLSWILKGVYLGRVLQNPPFHKLDLTRLYLYWSIILSLSSVSMKKEGAFICKRLYFCKTKIVPFYLFFLVFLVLPLGMCTSSNHGGCQGSGRSPWGGHLIWTGEVL